MSTVYVKTNSQYSVVGTFYRKNNNVWGEISEQELLSYLSGGVFVYNNMQILRFEIAAPNAVASETCQCAALLNDSTITTGISWSIISGSTYALIDNSGLLSIQNTADNSDIIIGASYLGLSTTHNMNVTYRAGSTAETTTEVVVDESGNSTTTITTVTENEDGSSYSESTSTILDESGNTIGTIESTTNVNTDGSYESSSTNYDENGEATSTTNASGDTDGNVSTQNLEYDESGNSVVVGYSIDTSDNPDGEKNFNENGVNTDYYAFDMTHGFEINIHFTINYSKQPSGQNENHHNILTMKRATPQPWYGFQLRHSSTNKSIILGTQFATGSNTNTNITGVTTSITNEQEFDLTITYNPTASGTKFICYDNLKSRNVYTSSLTFPDIEELRYLRVTIGHALDENGNPYRYSNINVFNFSLRRI